MRDSRYDEVFLYFKEDGHKYNDSNGNSYTSVTTLIHDNYVPKFNKKYWLHKKSKELGISEKQLEKQWQDITNEACTRGTITHNGLEDAIKKLDEDGIQVLRSVIMYEYPSKAKDEKLHAVAQLDCDDELKLVKATQINGTSIHGKIFDLEFVKRIGAKFCDELSINEEAPFVNFTYQVAEKKYDIWQPFYVWKYNANSVTRNIGKLYPIKGLDQYLKAARIWQKKVIAYDKFYGTSKFECRKVAGTLIQAFYWLEVESNKFKDIDSFKQYYDLDIEAAADFYANFSTHVTNNDIWQLSGNNRNYAAVSAWLNKLHDLKSST